MRRARSLGVDVSAEASPHHLLLTDEEVLTLDAARFKMSPPLAAESHRQALIEGLLDGTIDCIATDHAPHHPAEKEVPFPAAPNGVIGLETAFPALVHGLVEPGVATLELIVERMTAGPARAFGLPRPRIAVGGEADLALWDLRERYTVSEADLHSRSRNCAFLGREVQGRCLLTLAGGRSAHTRGRAGGGMSDVGALPRGRHGLARRERRRARRGGRRGRVHDGHDGLPGSAHRSELRPPDPHVHGADDRQLRRRGRGLGVAPRAADGADLPRGAQLRAERPARPARLAARGGHRRALGARHARARAPPARPRRHARRGLRRGRRAARPRSSCSRPSRRWRAGCSPARSPGSSTACRRRPRAATSSCSTTAPRPRSCACSSRRARR